MSIRPQYASKILEGEKTVELRRRFPVVEATGSVAVIYSSSPVQAVIGYARIAQVLELPIAEIWKTYGKAACVTKSELYDYFAGKTHGFAILLRDVKALGSKLTIDQLEDQFGFVPPQSFRYLDAGYNSLLSDERLQTANRHKRRYRA